jgi:hypothetical protein
MDYSYDDSTSPPAPVVDVRMANPQGDKTVRLSCILATATSQTKIPKRFIKRLGVKEEKDYVEIQGKTRGYPVKISLGPNCQFPAVVGLTETTTEYGYLGRDILNKVVLILDGRRFKVLRDCTSGSVMA